MHNAGGGGGGEVREAIDLFETRTRQVFILFPPDVVLAVASFRSRRCCHL